MTLKFAYLLRFSLPAFFVIPFSTYHCFAETLISFKDGSQTKTEDLLARGKALVYIERDCPVCHQYIQELAVCKESVKEKLQIVSVNTPAQTKEMARKIPSDLPLYIVKGQKVAKSLYATPTTRTRKTQKVGIQRCGDLEKLISAIQK
ncbi:MAG: peroxiredoxin family protein [Bdellovibrionaceae bacterium]|nr:peroxiredoxin family protein [Pseudobdellovibrionaceae bacterium]